MYDQDSKQRIIQEYVPGKQVTLAHVIARPEAAMLQKVGLQDKNVYAVGIMTITPSEAVMIAADMVLKASNTNLGFLDRFNGSLIVTGTVSDVETALIKTNDFLSSTMGFTPAPLTKS
ncbi:MAG: BMC domain-containing protein [Treponemataceae bacterium]